MATFRNLLMMMSRVKAVQLPPLMTKQSSKDADGIKGSNLHAFSVIGASTGFCILVIAEHVGMNLPICLSIALVAAVLSGLCLAEFLTLHAQGCNSVYSCLYQSISEFVAFLVGWMWLMSLTAVLSVISNVISTLTNNICNGEIKAFTKSTFAPYDLDVASISINLFVVILSITGINFTSWWLKVSMPLVFLTTVALVAAKSIMTEKSKWLDVKDIHRNLGLEQILTGTVFCYVTLLGAQSALRLTTVHVQKSASKIVGVLNILCYLTSLVCGSLLVFTGFYNNRINTQWAGWSLERVCIAVSIAPLFLLALEHYQPPLILIKDMASDGLICRCLSKRWKPFCQKVPNLWVFILTSVLTSSLIIAIPPKDILKVVAVGPLFISTVVVITVMVQRYKNSNSWQYEPMLQNGAAAHLHSRKKSMEFRPSNDGPVVDTVTSFTDSEDSWETDIDSVVNEYKESLRMSDLSKLESTVSHVLVQEPTTSSSFQAKLLITAFVAKCVVFGVTTTVAARMRMMSDSIVIAIEALTLVLSFIVLLFLNRLPQNKNSFSSTKVLWVKSRSLVPMVPWVPALSLLLLICLLIHVVVEVWHVFLGWILLGMLVYLTYGMRNSTAATSFSRLSLKAKLSLEPFPIPKQNSIRQVMLPERRRKKQNVKGNSVN